MSQPGKFQPPCMYRNIPSLQHICHTLTSSLARSQPRWQWLPLRKQMGWGQGAARCTMPRARKPREAIPDALMPRLQFVAGTGSPRNVQRHMRPQRRNSLEILIIRLTVVWDFEHLQYDMSLLTSFAENWHAIVWNTLLSRGRYQPATCWPQQKHLPWGRIFQCHRCQGEPALGTSYRASVYRDSVVSFRCFFRPKKKQKTDLRQSETM